MYQWTNVFCDNFNQIEGFIVPIQYLLTRFCIFVCCVIQSSGWRGVWVRNLSVTCHYPKVPREEEKSQDPPSLHPTTHQHHGVQRKYCKVRCLIFLMLSLFKYAHSIYFKYLTVEEEDMKRKFEIYIFSYIHVSHICKNTKWILLVKH